MQLGLEALQSSDAQVGSCKVSWVFTKTSVVSLCNRMLSEGIGYEAIVACGNGAVSQYMHTSYVCKRPADALCVMPP